MRAARLLGVGALLAGAAFVACETPPIEPVRAPIAPTATATHAPPTIEALDAGPSPAASTTEALDAGPPPPPPSGDTPGRVACGATSCELAEQECCDGACVAKGSACAGGAWRCDDASDCAAGEVCCVQRDPRVGGVIAACGRAPCALLESCARGGTCSRGLVCAAGDTAPFRGVCAPHPQPATCGGRRCPAAAPRCCAMSGGSRCVKDGDPCDALGGSLECTSPRDCVPYVCCDYKGVSTTCQDGCGGLFQGTTCTRLADCPKFTDDAGKKVAARACALVGEMMPGVKRCVYP